MEVHQILDHPEGKLRFKPQKGEKRVFRGATYHELQMLDEKTGRWEPFSIVIAAGEDRVLASRFPVISPNAKFPGASIVIDSHPQLGLLFVHVQDVVGKMLVAEGLIAPGERLVQSFASNYFNARINFVFERNASGEIDARSALRGVIYPASPSDGMIPVTYGNIGSVVKQWTQFKTIKVSLSKIAVSSGVAKQSLEFVSGSLTIPVGSLA